MRRQWLLIPRPDAPSPNLPPLSMSIGQTVDSYSIPSPLAYSPPSCDEPAPPKAPPYAHLISPTFDFMNLCITDSPLHAPEDTLFPPTAGLPDLPEPLTSAFPHPQAQLEMSPFCAPNVYSAEAQRSAAFLHTLQAVIDSTHTTQQQSAASSPSASFSGASTLSGSLDLVTGIFQRSSPHRRLRTAHACDPCRKRKAKVRFSYASRGSVPLTCHYRGSALENGSVPGACAKGSSVRTRKHAHGVRAGGGQVRLVGRAGRRRRGRPRQSFIPARTTRLTTSVWTLWTKSTSERRMLTSPRLRHQCPSPTRLLCHSTGRTRPARRAPSSRNSTLHRRPLCRPPPPSTGFVGEP